MPTVTNTVRDAAGNAAEGVKVEIELSNIVTGQPGFVTATDYSIVPPVTLTTDVNGLWSAALVGNPDVAPGGTVYKVTETVFRAGSKYYYISVPSAGGPYWAGDLISGPPSLGDDVSFSGRELTRVDITGLITSTTTVLADLATISVPVGLRPVMIEFYAGHVNLGAASKEYEIRITDNANNLLSHDQKHGTKSSSVWSFNPKYPVPVGTTPGTYNYKARHALIDSPMTVQIIENLGGVHFGPVYFRAVEG